MIPNMAKDWFIWDRNNSNVGLVAIDGAKGSTLLGEGGLVEDRIRRTSFDTVGGGSRDIPQGK